MAIITEKDFFSKEPLALAPQPVLEDEIPISPGGGRITHLDTFMSEKESPSPVEPDPIEERPTSFLPTGEGLTATQRRERAKADVVEFARPTLEMGGLLAGEAVGFAAGLPVPVPGSAPLAAVAGGGLGFAFGKNLADLLEQRLGVQEAKSVMEELSELPKELTEGAAFSATGQVAGPVIKILGAPAMRVAGKIGVGVAGVTAGAAGGAYLDEGNRWRGAMLGAPAGAVLTVLGRRSFSKEGIAKRAYANLMNTLKGTEVTQAQIDKNIKAAKKLEAIIQKGTGKDFRFAQGQLTNDASAILLQRRLARTGGGEDLSQSHRELANTILDEYFAKKVAGKAQIRDFPKYVENVKQSIIASSKEAEHAVGTEVERLARHMDEQVMGKSIHSFLSKGKAAAKKKATELYNKIPNVKLPSVNLNQGIDDLIESQDNILGSKTKAMIDLVSKQIVKNDEPVDIGYRALRSLRTKIGRQINAANSGATPDLEDARQLGLLMNKVDDAMGQVRDVNPKIKELYDTATSFYRDDYIPAYRQGSVSAVLRKGPLGEDTRIALANIAKSFNTLDGVDHFTRAVGNDKNLANAAMKDFYSFDFLNNGGLNRETGQLVSKKVTMWLAKNEGKLKKLGIYDDFANVGSLQKIADEAAGSLSTFNKSVAGKVLEADLDTMITNAFRGSKNFAQTARELKQLVKGDKAAEEGLKKAFAENIMKQSETSVPSFFQEGQTGSELAFFKSLSKLTNQIKKYTPALREMYKDDPEKVKALNTVWKAYLTLGRTAKSPIGGGSDTFELFGGTIGKILNVGVGTTAPGKWYGFKTVRDWADKYGGEQVDALLRRAMFDPDYAQIIEATFKIPPIKARLNAVTALEPRLNQLMTAIASKTIEKTEESNEENIIDPNNP